MPTPRSPPSLFEILSIELLERIFLFTSPRDILRLASVNRAFHKLVQGSPSTQYEIDLFAVGLQRNPRFEGSIADCRVALEVYRTRWETLNPTEKRIETLRGRDRIPEVIAVDGVHGLRGKGRVEFLVFGSTSRGIPRREWGVPLRDIEFCAFTFCPQADVLAIAGNEDQQVPWEWKVQLRTLSDGEPHPSAQNPVLSYTFEPEIERDSDHWQMSITSSRLAALHAFPDAPTPKVRLIVWNWTTGQVLLDLNDESYWSFTFVDDSWLLVLRDGTEPSTGPQGLIFLNTKQAPLTQTTFCYDPSEYVGMAVRDLVSDPGGYRPSPEDERFAPFYPDPSQRVFVVETTDYAGFLVMKTEVLLRLAQEREGEDLRWEEWGAYMTRISRNQEITSLWVSGPLLFCVYSAGSEETMMDVYDFSARASARYAKMVEGGSAARYEPSITQILPWRIDEIADSYGCHDSITFVMETDLGYTMHVWNFV